MLGWKVPGLGGVMRELQEGGDTGHKTTEGVILMDGSNAVTLAAIMWPILGIRTLYSYKIHHYDLSPYICSCHFYHVVGSSLNIYGNIYSLNIQEKEICVSIHCGPIKEKGRYILYFHMSSTSWYNSWQNPCKCPPDIMTYMGHFLFFPSLNFFISVTCLKWNIPRSFTLIVKIHQ